MSRFGLGIDEEARGVGSRWPYRVLVATALVLLVASPAAADPGSSPTTAPSGTPTAGPTNVAAACGRLTPVSDQDLWLLTPIEGAEVAGRPVLVFRDGLGESHSVRATAGAGGAAHARTPAGWSLREAPAGYRVAACPAAARATDKPADLIAAAPTVSTLPKPRSGPAAAKKGDNAPRLANTGQDIGAMVLLGLTLVLAGALLLIVRRRPKEAPARAPAPAALYWVTAELPIVEPRPPTVDRAAG